MGLNSPKRTGIIEIAMILVIIFLLICVFIVYYFQDTFLLQVFAPTFTIVIAILISLRSAKSSAEATEQQISAIQKATKDQIDSAMKGFNQMTDNLQKVSIQLNGIADSLKASGAIQQALLEHGKGVEEGKRLNVIPKLTATLRIHGLLQGGRNIPYIGDSLATYQVTIENETIDARDIVVSHSWFDSKKNLMTPMSDKRARIAKDCPMNLNCGSTAAIDRNRVGSISVHIELRDTDNRPYLGDITIGTNQLDSKLPILLTLMQS